LYRNIRNYENVTKMNIQGVGEYDIPAIAPAEYQEAELISFNYAKSCKSPANKAVHFFVDDYQFNRVWNCADDYISMLRKFRYVCTPDFSLYTDHPRAIQIYNHYRKHWCGAYWQAHGIRVVPTIGWSDETSFAWCFDGEPTDSVVAVSSVGTQNSEYSKELFLAGYREMMKRLTPTHIIFYGKVPKECEGNIIRVESLSEKLKKRGTLNEV
jgi:hypothetical protein